MTSNKSRHKLIITLKRRLFWLLLFGIILPATTPAVAQQTDAASQYDHAISILQKSASKLNYAEAVKWLRLAAEQGHAHAQYGLALRYLLGQGVQKDPQIATTWLLQAADQGLAEAQFSLGLRGNNEVRMDMAYGQSIVSVHSRQLFQQIGLKFHIK